MLMIRFQRIGRKNDPAFRMVVLEKASGPKAGTYVDLVGSYNPKTKAMSVQGEKIKEWVAKGAQLSPSLSNLLISKGIIEGTKKAVISKKNLEKNVAKKAEEAAKVAAAAVAAEAVAVQAAEVVEEVPAAEEATVVEEVATVEDAPVASEAPTETPVTEEVAA